MVKNTKEETQELLASIIRGIQNKRGNEIVSLNLEELQNSLCNYFVICDAESGRQVEAIAESVLDTVEQETRQKVWRKSGFENAQWVLLDYFDIVVHIFRREYRQHYKIEELWADARTQHIEPLEAQFGTTID